MHNVLEWKGGGGGGGSKWWSGRLAAKVGGRYVGVGQACVVVGR